MANPEHVEILKQGKEEWNGWRHRNLDVRSILDYLWAVLTIDMGDYQYYTSVN